MVGREEEFCSMGARDLLGRREASGAALAGSLAPGDAGPTA